MYKWFSYDYDDHMTECQQQKQGFCLTWDIDTTYTYALKRQNMKVFKVLHTTRDKVEQQLAM